MSTDFVILALTHYKQSFVYVYKKKHKSKKKQHLSYLSTEQLIDLIKFKKLKVLKKCCCMFLEMRVTDKPCSTKTTQMRNVTTII